MTKRNVLDPVSVVTGDSRVKAVACSVVIACGIALCFLTRLVPTPVSDRGIFQSVGERLLVGDRLYVDVYDNKDPLFFYLITLERWSGPLSQYLFEAFFVLGTGWITALLAVHFEPRVRRCEFVFIWLAAALVASTHFYEPGMPSAPALFLSMAAVFACLTGRIILSGLATAAVLFTNILFFPPLVCFITAWHLLRLLQRKPGMASCFRYLASLGLGLAAVLALLFLRGELSGYLQMLGNNIAYTQQGLTYDPSLLLRIRNHLAAVSYFGIPVVCFCAVGSIWLADNRLHREQSRDWQVAALATAWLFPLLICEGAALASFSQHLSPWILLSLLIVALGAPKIVRIAPIYGSVSIVVLSFFALVGIDNFVAQIRNPAHFAASLRGLRELSPEARMLRQVAGPRHLTYARLGRNNDQNHAFGAGAYKLKCPEFHQYRFFSTERLNRILDCATTADVVIIHVDPYFDLEGPGQGWIPPFAAVAELNERWHGYANRIDRAFAQGWTCRRHRQERGPDEIRVCETRKLADRGP